VTNLPVLIAGAGIAGLTAAVALARAGVPVVLVERRAGFSEVGAGLQLSPNATSVLDALGLAAGVGRHAVAPRRLDIRHFGGADPYAGMPMRSLPEPDAAPFWCLKRADLQTALLDAARMTPGVRLLVGRSVKAIGQHAGAVSVTVESGRGQAETIEASAVIGADGLWSAVRRIVGDTSQPRFLGYEAWRTLLPVAAVAPFASSPAVNLWLGTAGHAVHYPVAEGREINLVLIRSAQEPSPEWTREGDPARLDAVRKAAAAPLRGLIEAAPGWQVWSLFDCAPAAMAHGRVALIGDAAHPVLPFLAQGAGLAIEDAGLLAQLLPAAWQADGQAGGEGARAVPDALKRFASLRAARCARVQETGRSNGRMYHAGFPLALARDLVLKQLGDAGMRKRYGWLYGWRLPAKA
jgi:salicylate hydroxylase